MQETPYKIHLIRKGSPRGATRPAACAINAILKFDEPGVPHSVYVEQVALRLAQTLHVPVADGVLTIAGPTFAYASLEIFSPATSLPNLPQSRFAKVAERYPDEVAALVAFDILIGNDDRYSNIKATVISEHLHLFRAFDHGSSLINLDMDPAVSIAKLGAGELIVAVHSFYGLVSLSRLKAWAERIAAVEDFYFAECCWFGKTFQAVSDRVQEDLGAALIQRKNSLPAIIAANTHIIRPRP